MKPRTAHLKRTNSLPPLLIFNRYLEGAVEQMVKAVGQLPWNLGLSLSSGIKPQVN